MPKFPVDRAVVTERGMDDDRQRDRRYHGGPSRALCLYSGELIDALAAERHPIAPGVVGENVTIRGVDWRLIQPGTLLRMGAVEAEVTAFTPPCKTISHAFVGANYPRISEKLHAGWSRVYVRILAPGTIVVGDTVVVHLDPSELTD